MSLVSVIIAVYNCEHYLKQAIDSILDQTYKELEILICDDCSTDRSWEILQHYSDIRIKLFRNSTNSGVVLTRNFLLAKASGEYFAIQDADDWSEPNRIQVLLDTFLNNQETDACASAFFRVNSPRDITLVDKINSFYLKLDDCLNLPFIPPSMMIHRRIYDSIGGYNPYFSGLFAEDLYWIILFLDNYKVLYLNTPLYYYRMNPNSITNTFDDIDKLVVMDIMEQLIHQRKSTGTDWVEKKEIALIEDFKARKFKDKKWLSEKYRIVAAVQRDGNKRKIALKMILKAISYNPINLRNYITLRYVLFF